VLRDAVDALACWMGDGSPNVGLRDADGSNPRAAGGARRNALGSSSCPRDSLRMSARLPPCFLALSRAEEGLLGSPEDGESISSPPTGGRSLEAKRRVEPELPVSPLMGVTLAGGRAGLAPQESMIATEKLLLGETQAPTEGPARPNTTGE